MILSVFACRRYSLQGYLLLAYLLLFGSASATFPPQTLTIGSLADITGANLFGIQASPGVPIAVSAVNDMGLLSPWNITLDYSMRDSKCAQDGSVAAALDLYESGVDVFVGPGCNPGCESVQFLAKHWNIPQISHGCDNDDFSNKMVYPMFSRTVSPISFLVPGALTMMGAYNWSSIAILAGNDATSQQQAFAIRTFVGGAMDIGIFFYEKNSGLIQTDKTDSLMQIKLSRRKIIVYLHGNNDIRDIMLKAKELDMLGGYAYILAGVAPDDITVTPDDGRNADALIAFQGSFVFPPQTNPLPNFAPFRTAAHATRCALYPTRCDEAEAKNEEADMHAAFMHDAVMLYSLAVQRVLLSGGNMRNGTQVQAAITSAVDPVQFFGASGPFGVTPQGDRVINYDLISLLSDGTGVKVAIYETAIGNLVLPCPGCSTILWPGNRLEPPVDTLLCQPGTFRDQDTLECVACPAGSVSISSEATQCDRCPVGTMAATSGSASCTPCPVGSATDVTGSTTCAKCAENSYADLPGMSTCTSCPPHTVTPTTGAFSVRDCACRRGYFNPNATTGETCMLCPFGGICTGDVSPPLPALGYWGNSSSLMFSEHESVPCSDVARKLNDFVLLEDDAHCSPHHNKAFYKCSKASSCSHDCVSSDGNLETDFDQQLTCRQFPTNICKDRTQGRMCVACSDDHFRLGFTCLRCPSSKGERWVMTLGGLALVLFVWLLFKRFVGGKIDAFKSILVFFQVTGMIGRFDMGWPKATKEFIGFIQFLNFDVNFLSAQCVIDTGTEARRDMEETTMIVQLALPIVVACIYGIELAVDLFKIRKLDADSHKAQVTIMLETMQGSFGGFLNLSYHTLTISSLIPFFCRPEPNGTSFMTFIPEIQCGTDRVLRMRIMGGLGLFVYTVGIPAYYAYLLFTGIKKKQLNDPSFARKAKFLYFRYEPEWAWYELAVLMRRCAFSVLLIIYSELPVLQAVCGCFFVMLGLALHYYSRPFWNTDLDYLESVNFFGLVTLLIAGILFNSPSITAFHRDNTQGFLLLTQALSLVVWIVVSVRGFLGAKHARQARKDIQFQCQRVLNSQQQNNMGSNNMGSDSPLSQPTTPGGTTWAAAGGMRALFTMAIEPVALASLTADGGVIPVISMVE